MNPPAGNDRKPGLQVRPDVAVPPAEETAPDEGPGVPGFRSWRGVYGFVFGFFVAVVIALTIFTHVYG